LFIEQVLLSVYKSRADFQDLKIPITNKINTQHKLILSTKTMSNQNNQVRGFARFSLLPAEVQLLIWEAVAESGNGAMLIESHPPTPGGGLRLRTIRGQAPSMLHVNSDSRAAGLRVYRLLFGMASGPPRPVYFDLSRDTLDISYNISQFQDWVARNPATGTDLALVQNLRLFTQENVARQSPFSLLRHFPALRHLQHGEWTPQWMASAALIRQISIDTWPTLLARHWTECLERRLALLQPLSSSRMRRSRTSSNASGHKRQNYPDRNENIKQSQKQTLLSE
jgi:hypothetical protein